MSIPSVDSIIEHMKTAGFANPTKYTVNIFRAVPIFGSQVGRTTPASQNQGFRDIAINCEIAALPGIGITTSDRRYYGPSRKMPYNVLHNEFALSFYCSEDHRERKYFEEWINTIANMTTYDMSFYDDYISTIIVTNYDNSNRISLQMKLIDAYPLSITPIDLGYSNLSSVEKVMVNFTYYKYEPFAGPTGADTINKFPI